GDDHAVETPRPCARFRRRASAFARAHVPTRQRVTLSSPVTLRCERGTREPRRVWVLMSSGPLRGTGPSRRARTNTSGRRMALASLFDVSCSKRAAVLVREHVAIRRQFGRDVVGRIAALVARRAVADLEIDDIVRRAVDQLMREAGGG